MENQEGKEGEKGCCSKGKCCGCKALAVVALLLIGGIGGYLGGRHCAGKSCPVSAAPQNPAK